MTPATEAHLARVKERFSQLMDAKYRSGQSEHGGYLWRKKMLPNIVEETLDLAVYVMTLEEQIEEVKNLCASSEKPKEVVEKIKRIL
jgi:hypothetical protein